MQAQAAGGVGAPNYEFTWEANSGFPTTDSASGSTSTYSFIAVADINIDVIVVDGCTVEASDEAEETVRVYKTPTAGILPNIAGCSPLEVCFTNSSTGDATEYNFYFETGASYSTTEVDDPDACYTFVNGSTFDVREVKIVLNASNNGCYTTDTAYVDVWPLPNSSFDVAPDVTTELNPAVQFTDLSSGTISVNYDVDYNVNIDSSLDVFGVADTLYLYKDTGVYIARQVVENMYGCEDESFHIVTM